MKMDYELSKLAKRDIDQIWLFTLHNWSKSQANKYHKEIFKEVKSICANPEIGKSIFDIKENHRIHPINSHLIVYKIDENKIYIDRVLHQRMDIEKQIE